MKTTKLFALLTVLLCATTTLAQTNVSTDQELRAAIQINNVDIKLLADIDLSDSTLEITGNRTLTIGDEMMVSSERMAAAAERKSMPILHHPV